MPRQTAKVPRPLHLATLAALPLLSWLAMMGVHELGHVLGAHLTGGRVAQVIWHPLTISRTDLAENPYPGPVVWAGPIVGSALPLLAWSIAAALRHWTAPLLRFFAGFCLIANGVYLGLGSFTGAGDAGDLLYASSPIWTLWLFGLICVPLGLRLWHNLGPAFGLVDARLTPTLDPRLAITTLAAFLATLTLSLLIANP